MSKFTPGPWWLNASRYGTLYIEARAVIETSLLQEICAVGPTETGREQQAANARLIAAAPDNYACNVELAGIVRELCAAYGHPLPQASLDRSDAAIQKATGEPQ